MLSSFFLWCAGADRDILNYAPTYERNRHIGLGATLLIPTILGFISMTYALSTFLDSIWACIILGVIWALIIFSVDRYIVSTYRKNPSTFRNIFSFQFLVRIVFSVFLGIVIAHPLVLRFFEDNLAEYNELKHKTKQEYLLQSDSILVAYDRQLSDLYDKQEELTSNIYRASEDMKIEKAGQEFDGYSGRVGEGIRFEAHREYKERNEGLLQEVKMQMVYLEDKIDQRIEKLGDVPDVNNDFVAQEIALGEMKNGISPTVISANGQFLQDESLIVKGKIIAIVELFILIIFVILDIIPVLFKTISYYGKHYDNVIDKYEEREHEFEDYQLPRAAIF
ncbi:MAG: DUF4407 domain-containing protein [Chitinophagales bacterium]|nr:DUF4407 domain-containing protein [Chitinophagales bacterium]